MCVTAGIVNFLIFVTSWSSADFVCAKSVERFYSFDPVTMYVI